MSDATFSHLDPLGRARMVDVTPKEPTHRRAVARCKVFMQASTTAAIANREVKKGDVLAVARVAGIQAAKRTSDMIPLCHPLLIGSVTINFEIGKPSSQWSATSTPSTAPGWRWKPCTRARWLLSRFTTCAKVPTGRW